MKSRFVCLLVLILAEACLLDYAQVGVTTYHNDNARTGLNPKEKILRPSNVNSKQFGKLFSHRVDGYVYAQPLRLSRVRIPGRGVHNVVYVATEHDSLYAFDADHGNGLNQRALWKANFTNPRHGITTVSSQDVNCTNLVPEVGITGTPVIDRQSGTIYLVARTKEDGRFVQRLHALDVASGREKFGGPVEIAAAVQGTGDGGEVVRFDPLVQAQRTGLLLQNGQVYIAWASHCDRGAYHGWVMAYHARSLRQTGVWNATPNGLEGGIWQSGCALAGEQDGAGAGVYFATGNGTFDAEAAEPRDFGDSIVKLSTGRAELQLADYFAPSDQADLDAQDGDLGSGGVVLLPEQPRGAPHRHLLVEASKRGSIYLIDRDHMGHFDPSGDQIVQLLQHAVGRMLSTPAWWNNNLYFSANFDNLKQFVFDPASGRLPQAPASASSTLFGAQSPTPSVSADGLRNAIVWVIEDQSPSSDSTAVLHAYDANDLSTELYNSAEVSGRDAPGEAVKFSVPTVANGKVYVGTVGRLTVYGLLH